MNLKTSKTYRVTILQVAKEAGVDRSTVSRVYNRPELLREDTINKVLSVAKRLGYSPNAAARALRTGQNQNIALIVPDLTNPFMPPIALAVQKEAAKRGYCVFIGNADENPKHEADLLSRFSDQVSGAVLVSPRSDRSAIEAMGRQTPLVLINRDIEKVPRVLIDSGHGMSMAVEHLGTLGHKNLAYISGPPQSWANAQRRNAVFKAAHELNINCVEVAAGAASFSIGTEIIPQLLKTGATSFLAFDDVLAQGIYFGLAEHNFKVPEDYSVVGCDDILGFPLLTTVSSQPVQAGRLAVDLLMSTLQTGMSNDVCCSLETELILRETIGVAKK